jgi:hypothetical protein
MTARRYAKLKPRLEKEVKVVSDKLFIWLATKYTNVTANPFKFYSRGVWPKLNIHYLNRKRRKNKSTKFWRFSGTLDDWLRAELPSKYMGSPRVKVRNFNPSARGIQNILIDIDVYPYAANLDDRIRKSEEDNDPADSIYYRLFGRKKVAKRSVVKSLMGSEETKRTIQFISNDEQRPIIAPAMQMIINFSVKRRVNRVIKEVLTNGR